MEALSIEKTYTSFRTAAISQKEKREKRLGRRTKSISRILAMFSKLKA